MSERRKMFQRIIGGSKGKGKQKEGDEGSRKHSSTAEEAEGSKRRAITPPEVQDPRRPSEGSGDLRSAPEEREGKRITHPPSDVPRRRSVTPVAQYEQSPRIMAWEAPEEYTGI